MRIEDLVAEATEQDEASFALAYPDPLLIGAGLVLTDLPDPDGEGTLMLGTDDQDLQVLEQSRAIGGRVFWIRPAAGGRLKVGPAHRATLGRERHNDVVLPDFPVSSVHCWFVRTEEGLDVVDADSTNGTFINGAVCLPKQHRRLASGDTLMFGRFAFIFWEAAQDAVEANAGSKA